ncbi:hypothetical protein Daura_21030 [Dactylosporangium aurantiacum]|uniref:Uncharacterized protein n=1 Tax=Dactylosporangium aurantiacum TaxID=35754 RepID=A0A9Q9IS87_9ACTN|nr:DUF5988 family protein [Dactylosporangium aurantiacum]MDG6109108.1 DUF5988 family protein [Dactylosporangium aurantiacum]UWZ58440.1 hypothetical protein Daura_21030 [Dactylosporangium aurantiacum]
MTDNGHESTVVVVLEGGPATLPQTMSVHWTSGLDKIKIPHRGGHEHFELIGSAVPAPQRPVFRWTTRTKVAE